MTITNNKKKKNDNNTIGSKDKNKSSKIYNTNFITDLNTLGRILASPNKKKILYSINIPKTPKEISKETNINFPTTSKTIKELEQLKLIEINNKNLRKGKIVTISKKGLNVLLDLAKKNKNTN
ncbi:MAG: winged helix-turn-helix domain-containing protein [Eubacteriales bacterium]|nr:winged helix-turn-helix domain-containing protein [Eubacteriales bacterium]